MTDTMARTVDFDVISDELHGVGPAAQPGFLRVRRLVLRNRRADGSLSRPYVCDFLARPKGTDAVVLGLYHRTADGRVEVLLRRGLRPTLAFGRPPEALPIADRAAYRTFVEVVAGIVEHDDRGERGVRVRAALEAREEAGYTIDPDDVVFLGAGTFPSPGSMPEKFWLMAAQVRDPEARQTPEGDGSPMEEDGAIWWADLDDSIEACVRGDIEDAKTELVLRRLRDSLFAPQRTGAIGSPGTPT